MISAGNQGNATDLAHAQDQLAKATARGDKARIADWNKRIAAINNKTFDRSKIPTAQKPGSGKPISSDGVSKTLDQTIGTQIPSTTFFDPNSSQDPAERQRYVDTAFKSLTKNFESDYGRKRQELSDQLVNSGNPVGSPLYNKQMELLNRDESDARANAQNQAQLTGADYFNQNVSNQIGLSGANNDTLGTLGGLKGTYAGIKQGNRELDIAFAKMKRSGGGAAPAQPESPFSTGLPPGFNG